MFISEKVVEARQLTNRQNPRLFSVSYFSFGSMRPKRNEEGLGLKFSLLCIFLLTGKLENKRITKTYTVKYIIHYRTLAQLWLGNDGVWPTGTEYI